MSPPLSWLTPSPPLLMHLLASVMVVLMPFLHTIQPITTGCMMPMATGRGGEVEFAATTETLTVGGLTAAT